MAIFEPTITKEGLRDFIQTYYTNSVLTVLLINDLNGDLTPNSTFASVVGLELNQNYGYSRKLVNVSEPTTLNENNTIYAFAESNGVRFTANGGQIPLFTHACIAKNTSTTPGDTTGKLLRIEPVNDTGVMLRDGESYDYKFEVDFSVSFTN